LKTRAPLLLVCAALGCDDLTVRPFAGAILAMTLQASAPTPPGHHLELWARDEGGIDRLQGIIDSQHGLSAFGLQIRIAVDPRDPCMIVHDPKSPAYGRLLTDPLAYAGDTVVEGVRQTPAQQAQQVVNHIAQVNARELGGQQNTSMLALVAYGEADPPTVADDATPAERAAACQAYWADPRAYTANPQQTTAPFHGALYGVLHYSTTTPPAIFDGIRIDTPTKLRNPDSLWMTIESVPPSMVDPLNRGPVFVGGDPSPGGRNEVHFDLVGPDAAGAVSVYTEPDDDSFEL
jgi:hypothetical protein